MVRALVLDIGGVLLRTEDRTGRQALEKKYGLPPGGTEALVFNSKTAAASTIGKIKPDVIWHEVAKQLNLSPQELEDFKQAFWKGDQIDLALVNFLNNHRSSYKTALLSNAWSDARQTLAEQYQIIEGKTVDHILISSELGIAKPDQRIYHLLAETINCEFSQILFVDDFIENIEAAHLLGMQTIHYFPGMDLINQLELALKQD